MSTKYTIYNDLTLDICGDVFEEDSLFITLEKNIDIELVFKSEEYSKLLLKIDKEEFKKMCLFYLTWCDKNE